MNAKSTSPPTEEVSEMQAAAELILQREETRQQAARNRAKQRRRQRRQQERLAIERMHRSVEVIKWCNVGICSVWVISFIISILLLVRVQSKVAEIEGQVDRIRHVLDNPFATAGARLGGEVDEKLKSYLGVPDQEEREE